MRASKFSRAIASSRTRVCAARMPFDVAIGPYDLAVEFREKAHMYDRRKLGCVNIEHSRIELRRDLRGLRLAEVFLDCIVRFTHFANGCQQGCVEEAYTHSFATGMVEFARRNPRAWLWFNLLLSEHLPGRVGYDRVVRNAISRPPAMPRYLHVVGHPITLTTITKAQSGSAFGWYHFKSREAQLYVGLTGSNLAVVALHEITHAVHHMYGLTSGDGHRQFREAQVKGWLSIMKRSPDAWRWLAWVMSFPERASLALASRAKPTAAANARQRRWA
jgi:hypothetical protein